MSLKPPKKSDLDKSWMKARRDKPKKIQPEYHLIITEGLKNDVQWTSFLSRPKRSGDQIQNRLTLEQ